MCTHRPLPSGAVCPRKAVQNQLLLFPPHGPRSPTIFPGQPRDLKRRQRREHEVVGSMRNIRLDVVWTYQERRRSDFEREMGVRLLAMSNAKFIVTGKSDGLGFLLHRPNNGKPESKCEQRRGFSRHQLGYGRIGERISAGVARRCEGRDSLTHTLSSLSLSRPALCALRSLHWCGTVGGIKLPIGLSGWSSRLGISGSDRGCMFHRADTSMGTLENLSRKAREEAYPCQGNAIATMTLSHPFHAGCRPHPQSSKLATTGHDSRLSSSNTTRPLR